MTKKHISPALNHDEFLHHIQFHIYHFKQKKTAIIKNIRVHANFYWTDMQLYIVVIIQL